MKLPIQAQPVIRGVSALRVERNGVIAQGCSAWDWVKCGAIVTSCAAACVDTFGAACISCMGSAYGSCKDCL